MKPIAERIIFSLVEACDNMQFVYLVHIALFVIIGSIILAAVTGSPELLA